MWSSLDQGGDRLQSSDAGVVAVHDLDLPPAALGVALVHAKQGGGEKSRLLSSRARADLEKDVARVVGIARQQEHLQLLFGARELLGQLRPLDRGHLVELVAGRQVLGELPSSGELPSEAAELLELGDDRLEFREGLLRVAHGAVVLDEVRVGQSGLEVFVLVANVFEFFEHDDAFSYQLSAVSRNGLPGTARERRRKRRESGAGGTFAARPGRRSPSSRSACGSVRPGRPNRPASVCP